MRNQRSHRYLAILLMFFLPFANAQESTDVAMQLNEDGSVVFRYYDPTAKTVKLIFDGDLRKDTETIQNESYHSVKMHRDSNGVWSYTTPVLAPEVYTYQFERDGECIPDPTNPDSIRVRRDKMSVFIIDRTPQTALYVNETLHGQMDTLVFAGTADRKSRMVIVYTPPQYAEGQRNLPVLYLLHGLNGNETAWNDRGRAVQILDNLIAQQKANPMILVMPDVNPECLIAQGEDIGLWENIVKYPSWNNLDFERCYPELDRYLNGIYHFSDKKGSRAVAGLSAGAKQSANLAIMYDSTFSAVGMFSPVAGHKQVPTSTFAKYWIGAGNGDIFYCKINRLRRRMQRNHIPYTMYNSGGGHTWRNWRIYFTEFSQTLFWNIEG